MRFVNIDACEKKGLQTWICSYINDLLLLLFHIEFQLAEILEHSDLFKASYKGEVGAKNAEKW